MEDAAVLLRCERKTVYAAVALNRLPHQRIGRRIIFSHAALMQWLATPALGRRASSDHSPQARPPTLREFAPTFLAIARANNKPSSVAQKEQWLRSHILPRLGSLHLDEVTYAVVEDFKLALVASPVRSGKRRRDQPRGPRPMAAKSVNNGLTVLRRMLSIARKRGLIASVPEMDWFRAPPPEISFLTFDEADQLLAVAPTAWRTTILLALRTGLRLGELLALQWSDVDLDAGRIHVRQNVVRGIVGTPKSGRARLVPLSDDARAALAAHHHARGPLVFCDASGQMLTAKRAGTAIDAAFKKSALSHSGWHVLRHSFASQLVMRGVSLKAVQELLGHSTIQMTMRYAHLAPEVVRDAVQRLDRSPADTTVRSPIRSV